MNKKIVFGIVIPLVMTVIIYFVLCTKITVKGSRITIDSWGHHIEGIVKNETLYQYVLKDQGVSFGVFSGDGFVTAIPLEKAETLRSQYGDFFKCGSIGAEQAIQSSKGIIFVAQNSRVKHNISKAFSDIKKNPTKVSFTGSKIVILKNLYFTINVEDTTGSEIFYVKDFKIIGPF